MIISFIIIKNFKRIVKPAGPNIQWPKGRLAHSSVVINSVSNDGMKRHYLLTLGGTDHTDCWIMNIENKKWKQVRL